MYCLQFLRSKKREKKLTPQPFFFLPDDTSRLKGEKSFSSVTPFKTNLISDWIEFVKFRHFFSFFHLPIPRHRRKKNKRGHGSDVIFIGNEKKIPKKKLNSWVQPSGIEKFLLILMKCLNREKFMRWIAFLQLIKKNYQSLATDSPQWECLPWVSLGEKNRFLSLLFQLFLFLLISSTLRRTSLPIPRCSCKHFNPFHFAKNSNFQGYNFFPPPRDSYGRIIVDNRIDIILNVLWLTVH